MPLFSFPLSTLLSSLLSRSPSLRTAFSFCVLNCAAPSGSNDSKSKRNKCKWMVILFPPETWLISHYLFSAFPPGFPPFTSSSNAPPPFFNFPSPSHTYVHSQPYFRFCSLTFPSISLSVPISGSLSLSSPSSLHHFPFLPSPALLCPSVIRQAPNNVRSLRCN